jgi:hypothetical protein
LNLSGAATIHAPKASQFTEYTFSNAADTDSTITKVADTQTVNANSDVIVTAAGYALKGTTDVDTGDTAAVTAYAGTLNITAKGATQTGSTDQTKININASASALNLAVSTKGSTTDGVTTYTASDVVVTGDFKTATITVNNSANNSKLQTSDITSTVSLSPSNATNGTAGALTNMGNLTSLTVSGTGIAVIDNSGTGSKLATIDASGLVGKVTVPTSTTLGDATAGLSWTAGTLAETVKLGSALDTLTFGTTTSTYAKMDSITGYSVVANAGGDRVAAKSDNIKFATALTFVAKTTGVSGSLDSALIAAGSHTVGGSASDNVVFQNGGNTYIYTDVAANGLDDDDVVIELVGLVDLTQLIADLGSLT